MASGSRATAQLKKFLDQQDWKYLDDGDGWLRGLVSGERCQWQWAAGESSDARYLLFYAHSPLDVPWNRLTQAAEYISRANLGLYFGNFEMNWANGHVTFRTSIPIASTGVTIKALECLVFGNCARMDNYLSGLFDIALGNALPEQAIQEAEKPRDKEPEAVMKPTSPGPAATGPLNPGTTRAPQNPNESNRLNRFFPTDN